MGSFGITEIVLILIIVLVLFGGKKIPELARGLGNGWREFKKASRDTQDESEPTDKDIKKLK
jgi:sec-independent protein translocase protein TatA